MKRQQLKQKYREALLLSPKLRKEIAVEIISHEQTIKRWALHNSDRLTSSHFITAFRKITNLKTTRAITELTELEIHPVS